MSDEKEPPWLLFLTNQERLRQDIAELSLKVVALEKANNNCADAFPGGDAESHRRIHEAMIRQMENRSTMLRNTLQYVLNAIALIVVAVIGSALWSYTSGKLTAGVTSAGSPSHVTKGAANETNR